MTNRNRYAGTSDNLIDIAQNGWGIAVRGTLIGAHVRLEKGVFFRGGWWRPTLRGAIRRAAREAEKHPFPNTRRGPITTTEGDEEWGDE